MLATWLLMIGLAAATEAATLPAAPTAEHPTPAPAVVWQTAALYGADVRSLAIDPKNPDLVFAGTSAGQVYVSSNGGASWRDLAPVQPFLGWVVSALRFDPNRPDRLWAGLWGPWGGGMVAYSEDGGAHWTYRTEVPGGQVYSLALVPGREGQIFAGTRRGVYVSSDFGAHWTHATAALPEVEKVTSLLVDDLRPGRVYAGSWQCAYLSEDGGRTWRGLFTGMLHDSEVFSLTPVPGRPEELWASTCGWVYKSGDRGETWTRQREGLSTRRVPSFAALADGRLLAGTVAGLYATADSGATWQQVTGSDLAVLAIAVHPARPGRVILGTEGSGVWLSNNGGATFARAERSMTNVRVGALISTGREVLAAVNHAGPASGIYSSIDGGLSFQLQRAGLPTALELATGGGKVFAATERGLFERDLDFSWRHLAELGETRVDGVWVAEGKVRAQAGSRLFERPMAGPGGERFVEVRIAGAEAGRVAVDLEAARSLPTGDERFPWLALSPEAARLFDRQSRTARPLRLPVPAQDVTAALIFEGKLLLGTAGYGVLGTRFD